MFKRPQLDESRLVLIESKDSVDDLLRFVSSSSMVGKMIGDVFLVWAKLVDWVDHDEANDIVPFYFGQKMQKHNYRFHWMSRPNTPNNVKQKKYNGTWFDIMVLSKGSRQHIKRVKLCANAIKCFQEREELFKEIYQ